MERYLCFAREFALALRRSPAGCLTRRASLTAQKWFRRGLSGALLWRVGEAVIKGSAPQV